MREAISFSGGKKSMQLVKLLKSKSPKPILLTYLPDDDTAGLVPLFKYFARKEGFEIEFTFGKESGLCERWSFSSEIDPNDRGFYYRAEKYDSQLMKYCRNHRIGVLYSGRKKSDLYGRELIPKDEKIVLSLKTRPQIIFPLWEEK